VKQSYKGQYMPDPAIVKISIDSAIQQMKFEIAEEFGIILGGDTSSRDNGTVGGEITKRMVRLGEDFLHRNYTIQ
jgi:hypothetical protein